MDLSTVAHPQSEHDYKNIVRYDLPRQFVIVVIDKEKATFECQNYINIIQ